MKQPPAKRPVLPAESLHRFLEKELLSSVKAFRRCWRKCREKPGEKAVHQLRVESRRLLAELGLLSAIGFAREAEALGKPVRKLLSALSRLRDAQVQRLFLKEKKSKTADFSWLEREFQKSVRRQRRRVEDKLEDVPSARIFRAGRDLAKNVQARGRDQKLARVDASLVFRSVERSFAKVGTLRDQAKAESPESLHAVRIAFKGFRYQVEFLGPLLGGLPQSYLERLHGFQRVFGEFNDADVLVARLTELAAEHPKKTGVLKLGRTMRLQSVRLLKKAMGELDELKSFWPLPVSG